MAGLKAEAWILVAAGAVVTALVVAGSTLVPAPPARMALPTAGELLELEPYLEPPADGSAARAGLPPEVRVEGSPFGAPPVDTSIGARETGPRPARWAVTAIMIAGERRVAIVNEALVRPGDRLEDGARIAAIESDHIVLITPAGERRRLELER